MLLHEYPAITRHHFYGGNLPIHKAVQNKCCFQIIENWFRHGMNCYDKDMTTECCHCTLHAWMRIIILMYPEGLTIRYNDTQLPLHYAVAQDLPLNLELFKCLFQEMQKVFMDKMLHIARKVKNVPECKDLLFGWSLTKQSIWGNRRHWHNAIAFGLLLESKCGYDMYVLEKRKKATTFQDIDEKISFHLACIWHLPATIMHKLLDAFKDVLWSKTKHDESLPLHYFLQTVRQVMTHFFLNMDDLSVSSIIGD